MALPLIKVFEVLDNQGNRAVAPYRNLQDALNKADQMNTNVSSLVYAYTVHGALVHDVEATP